MSNSDVLDMKLSRIQYLEQLRPPDGFRLHFAVAATYSLDVEVLLAACLILTGFDYDSYNDMKCLGLVKALREIDNDDRLAVFLEVGRFRFPEASNAQSKYLALAPLLENIVHPMIIPGGVFHPKFWLIEYIEDSKEEGCPMRRLRLCITSRNMNKPKDEEGRQINDLWLTLDEDPNGKQRAHRGMTQLIQRLAKQPKLPEELIIRMNELVDRMSNVSFNVRANDDLFDDYDIYAFMQGSQIPPCPLFNGTSYREAVIVSPFLSLNNSPLKSIQANMIDGQELVLFSTEYGFSQVVGTGELPDELRISRCMRPRPVPVLESYSGDIIFEHHTKAYAVNYENPRLGSDLYLGSLNATFSALNKNIELLVRLHSPNDHLPTMLKNGIAGVRGERYEEFEPIANTTDKENESADEQMRRALIDASKTLLFEAQVKPDCNGKFKVIVHSFEGLDSVNQSLNEAELLVEPHLSIRPLLSPQQQRREITPSCHLTFRNMSIGELSDYFYLELWDNKLCKSIVIKQPLNCKDVKGASHKYRCAQVEASITLRDTNSFLAMINSFFRGANTYSLANEWIGDDGGKWRTAISSNRALYEWLLRASTEDPDFQSSAIEARDWVHRVREAADAATEKDESSLESAIKTIESIDKLLEVFISAGGES